MLLMLSRGEGHLEVLDDWAVVKQSMRRKSKWNRARMLMFREGRFGSLR